MRYVTLRARPAEGTEAGFHPIGRRVIAESDLSREALHRVELLTDGTASMVWEVNGDLDRLRELLADQPEVHEFSVSAAAPDWGFVYTRFDPTPTTRELMEARRELPVLVRMPIDVAEDGSVLVTYVGPETAFAELTDHVPGDVEVELVETGEYHPEPRRLYARLTERQRDVLEAAVAAGYYESPREATHEDVAGAVGLSPATVGEHLRKAESRVFGELVGLHR